MYALSACSHTKIEYKWVVATLIALSAYNNGWRPLVDALIAAQIALIIYAEGKNIKYSKKNISTSRLWK